MGQPDRPTRAHCQRAADHARRPLGRCRVQQRIRTPESGGLLSRIRAARGWRRCGRGARLPQAHHARRRSGRDRCRAGQKNCLSRRHTAGATGRAGHAHRHGRRRGQFDGHGQQCGRAGLRLGAARQPRDPAPGARGHQPLRGAGRGQPHFGDSRCGRGRPVQRLAGTDPRRRPWCAPRSARRAAGRQRHVCHGNLEQRKPGTLCAGHRARIAGATALFLRARALPVGRARQRHRRAPTGAARQRRHGRRPATAGEPADGRAAGPAAPDAAQRKQPPPPLCPPGPPPTAGPRRPRFPPPPRPPLPLHKAVTDVLAHPTVASKRFLVSIGDRTVGGLVHRDQMVGPWQVPVADCAITLADYQGFAGAAMAIGERTPLAALDAPASGRMAVAEAITNLLAAPIDLARVKLSANWMAACGEPGEDAALYATVAAVGLQLCPALGLAIPVGKDSLSMRTQWREGAGQTTVSSPVSLIVSAFAALADVRTSLTPQLDATDAETSLVLVDLGRGRNRMGASILAQTLEQSGCPEKDGVPDLDAPQDLLALVGAVNALRAQGRLLAYHDRSDGGLLATVAEMAFAGQVGVALNVDLLVTEGDGIGDSRMDTGDAKNWAGQVHARREERTLKALFSEELGVVLQVRTAERNEVMQTLRAHGLARWSHFIGSTRPAGPRVLQVWRDAQPVFSAPLADLQRAWDTVSWKICRQRDNPDSADAEHAAAGDPADPGLHLHLQPTFDAPEPPAAPGLRLARPRVAILREQGVNSHVEMAYAFTEAGFAACDVHMTDLQTGRVRLADFKGLVACGGFSYGDTLGAGIGWARSISFNPALAAQFQDFFARGDTFGLGVCNGCQMFAELADIIPGAQHWPRFTANQSQRFESRLSLVQVTESPSLFLQGMAGSRLPVPLAHGEGYADFRQRGDAAQAIAALRFVDNHGAVTERYPFNPNGSPGGLTGVTTADGRFTALMPHPQRVFRNIQMSWPPGERSALSPWMRLWRNARRWVG